jgi:hypothetical protein
MDRCVDLLDATRTYWVPAVVSPRRDWSGAPGCHRGARFLVDRHTFRPSREGFEPFDSRLSCLSWIMRHRSRLNRTLPGARIRAVPLDLWLLGLDGVRR